MKKLIVALSIVLTVLLLILAGLLLMSHPSAPQAQESFSPPTESETSLPIVTEQIPIETEAATEVIEEICHNSKESQRRICNDPVSSRGTGRIRSDLPK